MLPSEISARLAAIDTAAAGQNVAGELRPWTDQLPSATRLGVALPDGPPELRSALAWAGVPLLPPGAPPGAIAVTIDADLLVPECRLGTWRLPPPDRLRALDGVALAPLRDAVAQLTGCRLKLAPGAVLVAWPERCLVLNARRGPLCGYCYGPGAGQRTAIDLEPGGWRLLKA